MLVLTRRSNQSLKIGKDVVITVLEVRGDRVRIGIDADKSIRVIRTELEEFDANGLPSSVTKSLEAGEVVGLI